MSNTDAGAWDGRGARDTADPVSAAKDMASDAGGAIKQEAASFASAAQDAVQQQASQHKETAARAIGDFASAIRHAGEELAQHDQTMAGHLIRQAADGLGDLAHTLSDKRPDELLESLREFGRRNPVPFATGSVLAGFAIGRLLRSAAPSGGAPEAEGREDAPSATAGWTGLGAGASASAPQTGASSPGMSGAEALRETPSLTGVEADNPVEATGGTGPVDGSGFGEG